MEEDLTREWELFSREEKTWKGRDHFHERWIHRESRSGCVFFSTVDEEGRVVYVVEGLRSRDRIPRGIQGDR